MQNSKFKIQSLKLKKGFTLVELLIVIAILAILAVAVLSTINPIEQANKATDARDKNDAAEILSAIERYYATKQQYPWLYAGFSDEPVSNDTVVGFTASLAGVGICGVADGQSYLAEGTCTVADVDALLVKEDEIKTSFRNKSFLRTTNPVEKFYLYKGAGSSAGVSVCFIPRSKSTRTASSTNPLYFLTFVSGLPTAISDQIILNSAGSSGGDATHCPGLTSTEWTVIATACFVCVP